MSRFVKHTSCEQCGSKDNFALYVDDDGYEGLLGVPNDGGLYKLASCPL